MAGQPVRGCPGKDRQSSRKVYYSKEEHFSAYVLRLGSRISAKIGMKKDGTVTAVSGEWLVDTGAYSEMTQGMVAVGCGEAQLMIGSCQNWKLDTKTIVTNRNPSGTVRASADRNSRVHWFPCGRWLWKRGA